MGNQAEDSVLIQSLQNGHAIEFERSDATRKLRLFLSELLSLMALVCCHFIKSINLFKHIKYPTHFVSEQRNET